MAGEVRAVVEEPKKEEEPSEFDAAFAQISALDTKTEAVKIEGSKKEETPVKTEAEIAAEAKLAADAAAAEAAVTAAAAGGLPPDEKAKAEAAAAKVAADAATLEAAKKSQISDEELAARLAGLIKKTPPIEEPEPQRQQQQDRPSIYTKDEINFLTEYEKEYPDIIRAERLLRRAEYVSLTEYMFGQISSVIQPRFEMLEALAQRTHLGDLHQMVPNYDKITREEMTTWIGSQMPFLKNAYSQVIQSGSPEEVAELIKRYRVETGKVEAALAATDPAAAAAAVAAAAQKAATDAAASKIAAAAAKLAPVTNTKRSGQSAGVISPTDYDGAFEAFAKQLAVA